MLKKGFTLVELSIVLVIIGLLIGGLLVGQSMIRTAKMGAFIRQIGQFDIAVSNFRTKYGYLPGDSPYHTAAGDGDGFVYYSRFRNFRKLMRSFAHLADIFFCCMLTRHSMKD